MTSEVIDTAHPGGFSCCPTHDQEDTMTAISTSVTRTTVDLLRTVLRADAAVTGAVGLLGLLGPTSTLYGDVPGWLPRVLGAVLLVVAADLVLAARLSGSRLRLAGTVTAELALAWVVATVAVLALVDLPLAGREVLAIVGAATLGFAIAELRLVRSLSAAL
jgi:hypothetical protein